MRVAPRECDALRQTGVSRTQEVMPNAGAGFSGAEERRLNVLQGAVYVVLL